jgi:hypothetical protein
MIQKLALCSFFLSFVVDSKTSSVAGGGGWRLSMIFATHRHSSSLSLLTPKTCSVAGGGGWRLSMISATYRHSSSLSLLDSKMGSVAGVGGWGFEQREAKDETHSKTRNPKSAKTYSQTNLECAPLPRLAAVQLTAYTTAPPYFQRSRGEGGRQAWRAHSHT